MRLLISAVVLLTALNFFSNSAKSAQLPLTQVQQKLQLAKKAPETSASTTSTIPQKQKQQTPKGKAFDQLVSSSGRKTRQSSYGNEKPRSYSQSYNSGPQYYEVTSKPVNYHHEYHSPPQSYSQSYNTGPQGYSYRSPPQRSSHRDSYNHQDGNEYRDGDSSSTGDHRSYGDAEGDDYGGGGGAEYGDSNYQGAGHNDREYGSGNGGGSDEGGYEASDSEGIDY